MAHKHSIYDTDPHFKIDPATRAIQNESGKVTLMQYDHNSERFTFEIPRLIDGHDTSLCNLVTIHFDNVDSSTKAKNSDVYEVKDLQLSPASENVVIFSWLISDLATQFKGELKFSISFQCIAANGDLDYDWGTGVHYGITIGERLRNSEGVVQRNSDILAQWKSDLFGIGDTEEAKLLSTSQEQQSDISEAGQTQVDAVNARGAAVLDTIPDDYEALSALADENARIKAGAIVLNAKGESIAVADSANAYLAGMKLYGKSEQKSTTGKNLLPYTTLEISRSGVTYTPVLDDDGALEYVLVNGTATDLSYFPVAKEISLPEGDYIISGCPKGGGTETYDLRFNGPDARDYGEGKAVTVTASTAQNNVTIVVRSGVTVTNLKFYPMIRLASVTDDTYEAYTGGKPAPNPEYLREIRSIENPNLSIAGKNLSPINNIEDFTTLKRVDFPDTPIYPGVYSFSAVVTSNDTDNPSCLMLLYSGNVGFEDVLFSRSTNGERVKVENVVIDRPVTGFAVYASHRWNHSENDIASFKDIQIELGTEATEYEPYKHQAIALSRTLPGIPVTSGGNYTDSNGQQWICDEVDFERGVYIQRVKTVILDGSHQLSTYTFNGANSVAIYDLFDGNYIRANGYCTHSVIALVSYHETPCMWIGVGNSGLYWVGILDALGTSDIDDVNTYIRAQYEAGTPVTIWYPANSPIETPLSDAELLAFKALRSNKPVTTILNDSGMFMSVDYVADTKTYIDNKISEIIKNS